MSESVEALRIRRLLDVGRLLTRELDQGELLDRVMETAREITGARYAALGILNERHTGLERFVTAGVDENTRRAIGALPRGRGVLGVLIENPHPLRLRDVGQHPSSYGFPAGHPPMRTFLGVPVLVRGRVWGNLYLTEKADGEEFTAADEEAAVILADLAGIAIENARLYEWSERRRVELERAIRGLEATSDIAVAIGGEIGLDHVLELIVKRGRALVNARSLVIMLREGEELVVGASAGHAEEVTGVRLPISDSTSGEVLERGRPERISDVSARLRIDPSRFGVEDAQTALLVPMLHRGDALGLMAAFDRGEGSDLFTEDDEQTLRTFAASAATAVTLAKSVRSDRLRTSLAAAEAERSRWARELHDETLQGLAGLRVLLAAALRRDDPDSTRQAMREAIGQIEREIGNLRTIITELRPAALDELGLGTAIEALVDRHCDQNALRAQIEVSLPGGDRRLDPEQESTLYRVVQEALTNVAKHAAATSVRVSLQASDDGLRVEVQDDGTGFDPQEIATGFGLSGMKERTSLLGGSLDVTSGEGGTLVRASFPRGEGLRRAASGGHQAAS